MKTTLKKAGLPALVLLPLAFGMAGCYFDLGEPRPEGYETQPKAGVLTVIGAEDGVSYEAEVYDYPDDDVADAADLADLMSVFEMIGTGLDMPGEETLAIELLTPDGEDFTADGDFLVVLKDDTDAMAPLRYKGAVPFTGGCATVEYDDMETAVRHYTVTFDLNYTGAANPPKPQEIDAGGKATPPAVPARTDGYFFEGWFTQASGGTKYIFDSPVIADLPLYAKWTDEIKTAAIADEYLASKSANTADNPILLKMNLAIADNWNALVTTLASRTKYAALDLSACSMSGTAFDLYSGDVIGKNYIVSLILPDAATSIANSVYGNSTYSDLGYSNNSYSKLSTISGVNVINIGEYAFRGCTSLTSVSFPKATAIGMWAFEGCKALTAVSFPEATSIGAWAFGECTALTSVDFPKAVTIGDNAFNNTALTTASFPEATSIGKWAFYRCTSLTTASFPKATSVGDSAFRHCTALTTASFPKATSVGDSAFRHCTALTTASFPEAMSIGDWAFRECTALTEVSVPKVTSFGISVFKDSGTTPLTVTMGAAAPTVGSYMFVNVDAAKSVTVRVPASATGYTSNWQTAFKGVENTGTAGPVNININLVMQYY